MSLKTRIVSLIQTQGPMSVAQFMSLALLDPQEGYYATRNPFGKAGDFITAPEISQMFGELIGVWLMQAWDEQGRPKHARLVELGPGRATLMADIVRTVQAMPAFCAELDIVLIEASPVLKAVQAQRLRGCGAQISWQKQFDQSLADRPLFLTANEFFDALPLRQYVKTRRGWCERMVSVKDGALAFALAPVPVPQALIPTNRAGAPEGGVYESSPTGEALAEEIAHVVASKGGAALIIDYGYSQTGNFSPTLQAVSRHRFADVLSAPGRDDVSAHVDFAALAQAGRRGGAALFGPTTQGQFLANIGIATRAEHLMKANPALAKDLWAATERLIAGAQMGQLFKVLAFAPPQVSHMAGFAP